MSRRAEAEERSIREYLEWQAGDETISHLEKVASRRIGADRFDVWDVWTDQARWWVITPMTNLYLQEQFATLRKHLKGFARTTWQLVNWLTHAQNATRAHAMIALTACDHLAAAFVSAVADYEKGSPPHCPSCGSYQLRTFNRADDEDVTICGACDNEV